jgi:membrane protease subunit HflK
MKKTLLLLLIAIGVVVSSGFCLVAPGEVVVVRRLGRVVQPSWGPGLHWKWPLGIDRIDRIQAEAVRHLAIGLAGPAASDLEPSAGEVMTGDLNILRVEATVQYRVARPVDFVLHIDQVEPLLVKAADASLARAVACRGVDSALRADRTAIAHEVERELTRVADQYEAGVAILGVSLTSARPPIEVEPDFAAAQSAESESSRRKNEAASRAETSVAGARSAAGAKREAARGAGDRTILLARADALRFSELVDEIERSRTVAIRKLYLDSMQSLLERVKRKIVVPQGGAIDLTVLGVADSSSAAASAAPGSSPAKSPEPPLQSPGQAQPRP